MFVEIKGFEGLYKISKDGNILGVKNCIILKQFFSVDGYKRVGLCKNGKDKKLSVHRLVAQAFIPNPEKKQQVNHKNGIKTDNRVENLEWVTASENNIHAFSNGLRVVGPNNNFKKNHPDKGRFGYDNKHSKPVLQYSKDGVFIKEFGGASEAYRKTGIPRSSISSCCIGEKKLAGGFIWKFL